jgi:hypothetical protein
MITLRGKGGLMLDERRLRTFAVVAATGSIKRAAEKLTYTPPRSPSRSPRSNNTWAARCLTAAPVACA